MCLPVQRKGGNLLLRGVGSIYYRTSMITAKTFQGHRCRNYQIQHLQYGNQADRQVQIGKQMRAGVDMQLQGCVL